MNISAYSQFLNFRNLPVFGLPACLPACQPAVRPGCAWCRAPEISHDKGNGGGFTKMLFRRRFTQCAMTIPFILLSLSLFFFIPLEGVNLTFEGDDKLVTASAYYVTRINQLAPDIITVARCFRVYFITS